MKYNILITNDDGFDSKGIDALTKVAMKYGKVTVVAPENAMSGMSHAITMNNPLFIKRIKESEELTIIACNGTPVDCVKVAMDYIMTEKPTLLLSGINHGSNSNISVIYSGTMGAAREGAMCNVPSIGFSLTSHDTEESLDAAMKIVEKILDKILPYNKNQNMCLNVNIPTIPYSEIKGIKFCKHALGFWQEEFEKHISPYQREYVWMKGRFISNETPMQDSDEWLLKNGYVTIVPIKINYTDYDELTKLSSKINFEK